ncbi:uncharacterized protein LOC119766952 [Culex quinquefasciatus]|uniref:uncharacterized protein LOC119766952 n=1 Tax=Culex quinquefasciatus TaxID=7176 RepID=UPI0018E2C4A1|nr:uncharacterized protein LOC119766952 [Culex quinquefasciatus]
MPLAKLRQRNSPTAASSRKWRAVPAGVAVEHGRAGQIFCSRKCGAPFRASTIQNIDKLEEPPMKRPIDLIVPRRRGSCATAINLSGRMSFRSGPRNRARGRAPFRTLINIPTHRRNVCP